MKIYLLAFCTLLVSLGGHAQMIDTCRLTGDIKGLGNNYVCITYSADTAAKSMHYEHVRAHQGHFVLYPKIDAPEHAMIWFIKNHRPLIKGKHGQYLTYRSNGYTNTCMTGIILENRDMHWHTPLDSMSCPHIDNAPMNDSFQYYWHLVDHIFKSDSGMRNWIKANKHTEYQDLLWQRRFQRDSIVTAIFNRGGDSIATYIRAHPASVVSANLFVLLNGYPYEKLLALYAVLDSSLHSNEMVVRIKRKLEGGPHTEVKAGYTAPDIVLPDSSGKNISLSSLKGKYVLLDFWASWCGACRGENPNLVAAYQHLHQKGLEVYAVSLDTKKEAWLKAIARDKLSWIHVSDLKGWECRASGLYGVSGIPNNFLINPEGKIIATNVRGKNTTAQLAKLMK
jgi:peroxiredoxin